MTPKSLSPASAEYKSLHLQLGTAVQAFAAGELDSRAFMAKLNAIQLQLRALNMRRTLDTTLRRLASQKQP